MRKKIITAISVFCMSFFIIISSNHGFLYGDGWLITDQDSKENIWVDTSYWDYREVLVNDGHWEKYNTRRWVDQSHYVTQNKRVWVDTSYKVNQGYWKTENYNVWVKSGHTRYYQGRRWVDTSGWETRYRTVNKWVPVNLVLYSGCSSYGWNIYSFASRYAGNVTISYAGSRYLAYKYVIDYRPVHGGRVYAVKYHCYRREISAVEPYRVWVSSGYWENYTGSYYVDTSGWQTRTRKIWVDTSYRVEQGHWEYQPVKVLVEDGYWEDYEDYRWVDTSYYEYRKVLIRDGYYAEPLNGALAVRKEPKYIFTRWHKDQYGQAAKMDIDIDWQVENGEIEKVVVYHDVNRYGSGGTERVDIYNRNIQPAQEGNISATVKYDHAGDEDSKVHVLLYSTDDDVAHIYFSNPVNGYRSINLSSQGTDSNPDQWLGGESFGRIEF